MYESYFFFFFFSDYFPRAFGHDGCPDGLFVRLPDCDGRRSTLKVPTLSLGTIRTISGQCRTSMADFKFPFAFTDNGYIRKAHISQGHRKSEAFRVELLVIIVEICIVVEGFTVVEVFVIFEGFFVNEMFENFVLS